MDWTNRLNKTSLLDFYSILFYIMIIILIILLECAALLRYMGVRCQVVDFCGLKSSMSKAIKSSKTEKSTKSSKFGPKKRSGQIPNQSKITSFFDISGDEMTSIESMSTSPEPSVDMYHPLIQWVQIYFQTGHPRSVWDNEQSSTSSTTASSTSSSSFSQLSDSSEFIPPLYFQQDGHSRTLVGKYLLYFLNIFSKL